MRAAPLAIVSAVVVSLAAANTLNAQQADAGKRRPKQTHDKGVDDPAPAQPNIIGERLAAGVAILSRPDGTLVAQLDESFHDAVVAVKNADGTITYTCMHGLPAANGVVAAHANKKPAPATLVPAKPVLEEK